MLREIKEDLSKWEISMFVHQKTPFARYLFSLSGYIDSLQSQKNSTGSYSSVERRK